MGITRTGYGGSFMKPPDTKMGPVGGIEDPVHIGCEGGVEVLYGFSITHPGVVHAIVRAATRNQDLGLLRAR